jgi:hypothetical protein
MGALDGLEKAMYGCGCALVLAGFGVGALLAGLARLFAG